MGNNRTDQPILSAIRYAVVVTDKGGTKFVRAKANGHPTVRVCTPPLADDIIRDIVLFHSTEIAECYRKDTVDLVKRDFGNTRICPRPPFKAEVFSVYFTIGLGICNR